MVFIIIAILTVASGHRLLVTMEAGYEQAVTVVVRYEVLVIVRASNVCKMLVSAVVVNRDQMIQKLQLV